MNNNGAIYIAHGDAAAVAAAVGAYMTGRGFLPASYRPDEMSGRIMIAEKRRRLFFVLPSSGGWVTLWEDPRYFADRHLARHLAEAMATRAVWIEVSGNGVAWARGVYDGTATLEEVFDEVDTTFYGEYGTIHFAFDVEQTPDELIERLGLPYAELHYEAVLDSELPPEAGQPLHLAFERPGIDDATSSQSSEIARQAQ